MQGALQEFLILNKKKAPNEGAFFNKITSLIKMKN